MKSAAVGVLIFSLVAGSAAIAGGGGRDESHHDGEGRNWSQRDDHHDADHRDDHNDHHDDHHDDHGHGRYGDYHRPQGFHDHHWARGERLPKAYYASPYIVRNYRERGWRQPPRGYHWVRVDHDVVLAAVATGAVLDVLYNQF